MASGVDWTQPWRVRDLTAQCHSWPVLAAQLHVSKLDLEITTGFFQPILLVTVWSCWRLISVKPSCPSRECQQDIYGSTLDTVLKLFGLDLGATIIYLREERELPLSREILLRLSWLWKDQKKCQDCFSWHHRPDVGKYKVMVSSRVSGFIFGLCTGLNSVFGLLCDLTVLGKSWHGTLLIVVLTYFKELIVVELNVFEDMFQCHRALWRGDAFMETTVASLGSRKAPRFAHRVP